MAEETITAQTPEIDPGMSVMPEGPGLMDVPTVIPELGLAAQALASQVSFAKKTWKDGSGGGTPVTAAELNRMEGGISDCATQINKLGDSVSLIRGNAEIDDFNNLIEPGCYVIGSYAQNANNRPSAAAPWGILVVQKGLPDYMTQEYIDSSGAAWLRICWAKNWRDWIKIA